MGHMGHLSRYVPNVPQLLSSARTTAHPSLDIRTRGEAMFHLSFSNEELESRRFLGTFAARNSCPTSPHGPWYSSVMRTPGLALPPLPNGKERAMIIMRRRFKSLQERLSDEAQRLRAMANEMPTEAAKEAAL